VILYIITTVAIVLILTFNQIQDERKLQKEYEDWFKTVNKQEKN
jgi:preprotein translocase subunit YajC